MAYSGNLREEELKNKIAKDYFSAYDSTKIIGNIDFSVSKITDTLNGELFNLEKYTQSFLWAEAKRGQNMTFMNLLCSLF